MQDRAFRAHLFGQFARLARALASPSRQELIYLLSQGAKTVDRLAQDSRMSVANTSQHLQQLKAARLVLSVKEGQHVRYRLASESVQSLWQCLQRIGEERLLEVRELVESYLTRRDELEPVSLQTLRERVAREQVVVLDVRPGDEYEAGHLPQAISIPLDALESRLKELPRGREIVAYCRGPYCLMAFEAVRRLRTEGFMAVRLEGGLPEWKAAGLPVQLGAAGAS